MLNKNVLLVTKHSTKFFAYMCRNLFVCFVCGTQQEDPRYYERQNEGSNWFSDVYHLNLDGKSFILFTINREETVTKKGSLPSSIALFCVFI